MMITLTAPHGYFQLRAAAIIRRGDRVLIHHAVGDTVWSLPGGRVDVGETSATTIVREMAEELHTVAVVERLVTTIELIDVGSDGRAFHEVAWYYAVQLPELAVCETPFAGPERSNPVEFYWCPLADLAQYNLVPASIRPFLVGAPDQYCHLNVRQADYAVISEHVIPASTYDILS